jgi:hypothetical protein
MDILGVPSPTPYSLDSSWAELSSPSERLNRPSKIQYETQKIANLRNVQGFFFVKIFFLLHATWPKTRHMHPTF